MRLLIPSVALAALPSLAAASSDDAWAAFRAEVQAKCEALLEAPDGATVQIDVSPEGTSSYGTALVTVGLPEGGAERTICVMDKQTKAAELSTPLPETPGEGPTGGGMGQAQATGTTAGGAPAAEAPGSAPVGGASTPAVDATAPVPKPAG